MITYRAHIKDGTVSDIKIIFAERRYCLISVDYGNYAGVGVVTEGECGYHPISHYNYAAESCEVAQVEADRVNRDSFGLTPGDVADIVASAPNTPDC